MEVWASKFKVLACVHVSAHTKCSSQLSEVESPATKAQCRVARHEWLRRDVGMSVVIIVHGRASKGIETTKNIVTHHITIVAKLSGVKW